MRRTVIPPLIIVVTVITAIGCFVTAAAIVPPPLVSDVPADPPTLGEAPDSATRITSLVHAEPIAIGSTPFTVDMARLTFQPRSNGPLWALPGPLLLVIESGVLAATLKTPGLLLQPTGETTSARGEFLLRGGDNLIVPTATKASFRASAQTPAVAIAIGVFPTARSGPGNSRGVPAVSQVWSPAANQTPLAGGTAIDFEPGPLRIDLDRIVLEPGETLPLTVVGVEGLAIEAGVLTLKAAHGMIAVPDTDDLDMWLGPGAIASLLPGDHALLQHTSSATLRNDGSDPVQLLTFAVAAEGEE